MPLCNRSTTIAPVFFLNFLKKSVNGTSVSTSHRASPRFTLVLQLLQQHDRIDVCAYVRYLNLRSHETLFPENNLPLPNSTAQGRNPRSGRTSLGEAGFEPARGITSGDFKSPASAIPPLARFMLQPSTLPPAFLQCNNYSAPWQPVRGGTLLADHRQPARKVHPLVSGRTHEIL